MIVSSVLLLLLRIKGWVQHSPCHHPPLVCGYIPP